MLNGPGDGESCRFSVGAIHGSPAAPPSPRGAVPEAPPAPATHREVRAACGASALGVRRIKRGHSQAAARLPWPNGPGNRMPQRGQEVSRPKAVTDEGAMPAPAGRIENGNVILRRAGPTCPANPGGPQRAQNTRPRRLNGKRQQSPVGAGLTPRALAPQAAHASRCVAGSAPPARPHPPPRSSPISTRKRKETPHGVSFLFGGDCWTREPQSCSRARSETKN